MSNVVAIKGKSQTTERVALFDDLARVRSLIGALGAFPGQVTMPVTGSYSAAAEAVAAALNEYGNSVAARLLEIDSEGDTR